MAHITSAADFKPLKSEPKLLAVPPPVLFVGVVGAVSPSGVEDVEDDPPGPMFLATGALPPVQADSIVASKTNRITGNVTVEPFICQYL